MVFYQFDLIISFFNGTILLIPKLCLRKRTYFDTIRRFTMAQSPVPIPIRFWKSLHGHEPVRIWLSALPSEDKKVIGYDLAKLQFGWPLGLPLCRSLGNNLWEIRSSLPSRREARVIFTFTERTLVALHAFIKKSQKTPIDDLNTARQRLKDLKS